jgi:glycosyltransferase involved in cell wall biosynthesis
MKVLIISHTYIAAINRDKWKTFAMMYPHCEIKVLFPSLWPTHLFTHLAEKVEDDNLINCQFVAIRAFNVGNEVLYRYHFKSLYNVLKTFAPHIIHVEQGDNAFSFFQAILLAKLLRIKAKFIFFTWVNWKEQFSLKYRFTWKWIEKINLALSSGAIVGNKDAQFILQAKKFSKPTIVLPQLGVNQQVFSPQIKKEAGCKYIGYIGRIVDEKGVHLLLDAFMQLEKNNPNWHLKIVGRGAALHKIEQFISHNNLQSKIYIYPPVSHYDVAKMIATLDIIVLPSYDTQNWKEQFGHIIIEAMACAVPVIGSSAGEIPNVIQNAGLIFEQKNVASLLASLKTLMQDDEQRLRLGKKGLEHVTSRYSHKAIAHATYNFWQSLML